MKKYLYCLLALVFSSNLLADGENHDNETIINGNFSGISLNESSWIRATLNNCNFDCASLKSAEFFEATVSDSSFAGVNFTDASLELAKFTTSDSEAKSQDFSGANFTNANLRASKFYNVNFSSADMSNADLSSASFNKVNFTDVKNLTTSQLYKTQNYSFKRFNDIVFESCNLSNADFKECDFSNSSLKNVNASNSDFSSAKFEETSLENANFAGADLTNANFERAYIDYANFNNAKGLTFDQIKQTSGYSEDASRFESVGFAGANFAGADFSNATLYNCDFEGANLTEAKFDEASVFGVNFSSAVGFTKEQIYKTKDWQNSHGLAYVGLANLDLREIDLEKKGLIQVNLTNADISNARISDETQMINVDLRGAKMDGVEESALRSMSANLILNDGRIVDFIMDDSRFNFNVVKVDGIPARLQESGTISDSTLFLRAGAKFVVENRATLSLDSNGEISIDFSESDSDTSLNIASGAGFNFDGGRFTVNLAGEFSEDAFFTVLTWDDGATISGLNTLVKNFFVNLNGKNVENFKIQITKNALSVAVPEPSTYALIFGVLTIAFGLIKRGRRIV